MINQQRPSLKQTLRLLTIKWAVVGLALSLIAGGACLLYSAKVSSESQVSILAQSIGRAFRPQILRDDVRDAQFQIEFVLSGIAGSQARILDQNFKEIYPLPGDRPSNCKKAGGFCWEGVKSITYLHPIYFDDDRQQELYGYLSLTAPTSFNFPLLVSFGILILLLFIIQAYGLTSALSQISKNIFSVLTTWSNQLSTDPKTAIRANPSTQFKEFESMEAALGNLHLIIEKLEIESAKQAKDKA